jgi:hypothetical protein
MRQSKREIAFALAIVCFVYLSLRALRSRWAPLPVQWGLFVVVLLLIVLLIVLLNVAG